MTDRRSQYEGVDDIPLDTNLATPQAEPEAANAVDPGYQQSDRRKTPPFASVEERSDSPAKISTGTPAAKVHAETTPARQVVHPEPKSVQIQIEDRDPNRMNDLVKVILSRF